MKSSELFEGQLPFFPYGAQYHRAPTPLPGEWDGDLREIARVGYTHVQYRPQWRWHERLRGRPVWDDLDRLFDLAAKHGLRVVLKPMLETAPDWVFDELGGTRIGFHGKPISPIAHSAYYVGGWWPCFDNPDVREAAAAFVRVLAGRYARHPALWLFNAWNEPRSRPLGSCQCPHSVASYRRWLAGQYGSIEALNAALGKAWTAYESVQPPATHADYTEMFLWRKWAAWAVAGHVRLVADAIRDAAPDAGVMMHIGASSVVQDPACDTSDDLLNAAAVDRYGTSMPIDHHPKMPLSHGFLDFQLDWIRRVDPAFWCHEFYPATANWSAPPAPLTLARQIWMCLAGGAAAFTFWQYRSERLGTESNGYGLREPDGSPTERSRVCDAIAGVLREHGGRLAAARRPRGRVGLLHSRDSDLLLRIQAMRMDLGGADAERGRIDYPYKQAVAAAHLLYQANGECVEWVAPGDDLTGIRLLHVTAAELIPATAAAWLTDFVAGGGCLVVEFPFACRDDNTWLSLKRPAHGLDALLGCVEANRVVADAACTDAAIFPDGTRLAPKPWRIALESRGGTPIAHWHDGAVAAVRHLYKKGVVYALGASGALAFANRWDDPVFGLYAWLLREAGLQPKSGTPGSRDVWIKVRQGRDYEVGFVFNVSEAPRVCRFSNPPRETWWASGAVLDAPGTELRLEAGGTWVGEWPDDDTVVSICAALPG